MKRSCINFHVVRELIFTGLLISVLFWSGSIVAGEEKQPRGEEIKEEKQDKGNEKRPEDSRDISDNDGINPNQTPVNDGIGVYGDMGGDFSAPDVLFYQEIPQGLLIPVLPGYQPTGSLGKLFPISQYFVTLPPEVRRELLEKITQELPTTLQDSYNPVEDTVRYIDGTRLLKVGGVIALGAVTVVTIVFAPEILAGTALVKVLEVGATAAIGYLIITDKDATEDQIEMAVKLIPEVQG
jgi:hypothetical protein